jgi:hypothetical protein
VAPGMLSTAGAGMSCLYTKDVGPGHAR